MPVTASDKPREEETVLAAGERQGELRLAGSSLEIVPEENPSSGTGKAPEVCGACPQAGTVTRPSFVGWEPAASLGHLWWQQNRTESFGQNKEGESWLMLL